MDRGKGRSPKRFVLQVNDIDPCPHAPRLMAQVKVWSNQEERTQLTVQRLHTVHL